MTSFSGGGANSSSNSKGPLMDETKLVKYKTVMCQRMVRVNNCRYGHLCDFAHDANELRRNLNQHWYQGVLCEIADHDDKKCEFAHNEMELMYHPSVYKTKICDKYLVAGGCPKNQYCAYAHGKADLRTPKPTGQAMKSTGNSGLQSSPAQSPPSNPKNGANFENKRSGSRLSPAPEMSPQGHISAPHRQQSYPGFIDNAGSRAPMHVSPADLQQEFQDTTNDLKIRILDLVDQISSMHADRANYESHQKANQIVQDAYKAHREQTSALQRQIENSRLYIQALQGHPAALSRLSPAALQQLARKSAQAATAIAGYKHSASSSSHNLIQDLSELEL